MCNQPHVTQSTLYNRLFAHFYDSFMADIEKQVLLPKRKHLLSGLQGHILEVGAGTGINFSFYQPETNVLAVEPSGAMLRFAQQKAQEAQASIQLLQMKVGDKRLKGRVPTEGFDAIVCTLVLCSTSEPEAVIALLYKWLKPGGKVVILEHIQESGGWRKNFNQFINPLWKFFGQGCDLTRRTDLYLKQAGFKAEYETYFQTGLYFYEALLIKAKERRV